MPGGAFPPRALISPELIIAEFYAKHYLRALGFTIYWGKMERTADQSIYRQHRLEDINNTLQECARSIQQTQSIERSWCLLTGKLQWTSVIASKVLHFLCRALHFDRNPPVPIDGEVIRQYVWPGFRIGIPPG